MNNEQNNAFINVGQPLSPTNNQNQTLAQSNYDIPGANLTPIGLTPQPTDTIMPDNNIPVQSNSETTAASPITNSLPPLNSDNVIPINSNSVIPGIVNSSPVESINTSTNNLNQELNINNSSPFDIGLNSSTIPQSQPTNATILPINNINGSTITNEVLSTSSNNVQPLNNNLGDATPLTNVGNDNGSNDTISVKQYLLHMILCSIPLVGIIVLLMRAFSNKENKNISNLAKAQLLLSVIITVLFTVLSIVFGSLLGSLSNGLM